MKDFQHWIPMRISSRQSGPIVDWCHLGARRFTLPFFGQTITKCVDHPADLLFRHQTSLEFLVELANTNPGLPVAGFIFHMSRCGSTLMSQMFATLPQNIVLSEASPIEDILRLRPQSDNSITDSRVVWLQSLMNVLGQKHHPEQKRVFIKFDCWHTLSLPLIRRAFPDVPWIFLYREPVEVLVSHAGHSGAHMTPGMLDPALFGWDAQALGEMRAGEYGARALAKICEAALTAIRADTGKLINYRQLPAVWPALMEHWRLDFSPEETQRMLSMAKLDAKNPVLPFEDDTQSKNARATEEIRHRARQWLDPVHQQLEARRQKIGFA